MKRLLTGILVIAPFVAGAQDLYITGGYAADRPTVNDRTTSGLVNPANGYTEINSIKQNGFFAGLGIAMKNKKTSRFGLRAEVAYEHYNLDMQTTVTTQETPFSFQTTSPVAVTSSNSYLRLSPTISYYLLKRNSKNYQVDLGISQLMHLGGFKDSRSITAVHVSGSFGYNGILLKAGFEQGLGNTLGGERADDYNAASKRYFVGVNVYPFLIMKPKKPVEPEVILD